MRYPQVADYDNRAAYAEAVDRWQRDVHELAQQRAYAYLAAVRMGTLDLVDLEGYHRRAARAAGTPALRGEARVAQRMLAMLVARRTARGWDVAPPRSRRPARAGRGR